MKVNGWDAQQAGMFLGLSLAGPARRLLTGRTPATVAGYVELRQALVERFEPTNQEETYKAFLRTRVRKPEEGLQALQEDLMKYPRLAYPEADARTTDTLVLDQVPPVPGPAAEAVGIPDPTPGPAAGRNDGGGSGSVPNHRQRPATPDEGGGRHGE